MALTLHVDDWRWAGVPVHIRAGKALPVTLLDLVAVLRPPPRALFTGSAGADCRSTRSACGCSRTPGSPSRFW